MGKSIFARLILASALVCITMQLWASHAVSSDIYYECVATNTYLIRVNLIRDCGGISAPFSIKVSINGCNVTDEVTLFRSNNVVPYGYANGSDITPLCGPYPTTCQNGSLPGVQHYQYSGTWIAPTECSNWKVSFTEIARNSLTTTIVTPNTVGLYVEAVINNANGLCNSSPQFNSIPVLYYCYQDEVSYSLAAYDNDGDSLVFSLIAPMQDNGLPVTYLPTFSVSNPLNTNGTFTFNPLSSQINFVPTVPQVGLIAIKVDEYRNGTYVGSTMRDMELIILGSPLCNPPYSPLDKPGMPFNISGGYMPTPNQLEVCIGDTLRFSIGFRSPAFFVYENFNNAIAGGTSVVNRISTDSFLINYMLPSTNANIGIHPFIIGVGSDSCAIKRQKYETYYIKGIKGVIAGPDLTYCVGGEPVQLNAVGGIIHTWSPALGLSNPNIANPRATPTVTTDYVVQSNLSANCANTDTVRVSVVPSFTYNLLPATDTITFCTNNLAQLSISPDNTFAPYTYSWSPANDLSSTVAASTYASPLTSTTYKVTITSDTGCTQVDSIRIKISGNGPKVTLPGNALICYGDSMQLQPTVAPAIVCGASQVVCAPNLTNVYTNDSTGSFFGYSGPFMGTRSDVRYQVLFLATDLQAMGLKAGTITQLTLRINEKFSTAPYQDFSIKLGCTDESQMNNLYWLPANTTVFFASNYTTKLGVNDFPFSQNYDWDGVSNLVVEICYGNAANTNAGGDDELRSNLSGYPSSVTAVSSNAPDGCTLPIDSIHDIVSYLLPIISFYSCPVSVPNFSYQWSPTVGLSNSNTANPKASPTTTTTYTLTVNDGNCTGQAIQTINVSDIDYTITNDSVLCNSDTVQLEVVVNNVWNTVNCGYNGNTISGNATAFQIGNNTATNSATGYPAPYGHFYKSVRQQYLYRASDLLATGASAGRITALAFNLIQRMGADTYNNFSIRISCTDIDEYATNAFEMGNFVEVFSPKSVNLPNTSSWMVHTFDKAFDWDGTSNLLVELCFDNTVIYPSYTSNSLTAFRTTNYNAAVWQTSDNQGICNAVPSSNIIKGPIDNVPDIKFYIGAPGSSYPLSWSPSLGLSNPNINNPIVVPTTTTTYVATITDPTGCSKTDSVTIIVYDSLRVNISSNPAIICPGPANVTFTATTNAVGQLVNYQWLLNGNPVGTNSPALTLNNLNDGDQITCSATTQTLTCLANNTSSNTIQVQSANSAVVGITIFGLPPICDAISNNTFVAVAANGGNTPTYQWTLNGTAVGSNNDTLVWGNLNADDTIRCLLTSSYQCIASPTVLSNPVIVPASSSVSLTVQSNPDPIICSGTVLFNASPSVSITGGTYQWYLNSNAVGVNSNSITLNNLKANDKIWCTLQFNPTPCIANQFAISDTVVANACVGIEELANAFMFSVQPNPSSGIFYLDFVSSKPLNSIEVNVYDVTGRLISHEILSNKASLKQFPIDLSDVDKGVYILKISDGANQGHQRLVVY